jgi:hypothetical protein
MLRAKVGAVCLLSLLARTSLWMLCLYAGWLLCVTKTDTRTPADLNRVTFDCDQVFIDLSSARSMRLLCILPNGPRLLTRSRSRRRRCVSNLDLS